MVENEISKAADELRTVIALEVGKLADQILGRPEFGSPEWKSQHETRDTPEGKARTLEWHLTKIAILHEAGRVSPTGDVLGARKHGATWQAIADACGITKQAAFDRWAKYDTGVSGLPRGWSKSAWLATSDDSKGDAR
jgi:hypothetical protein